MGALFCLSQGCVEAPRGPEDQSVALSDPIIALPARCLCGRGFILLKGVSHRLFEGHHSSLGPHRLEALIAQPGTHGCCGSLIKRAVGLVVNVNRHPDGFMQPFRWRR
jgi:hypothetical protein